MARTADRLKISAVEEVRRALSLSLFCCWSLFSAIDCPAEPADPPAMEDVGKQTPAQSTGTETSTEDIILGSILQELLPIGYSGTEHLMYDICWSSGLKIGELTLDISRFTPIHSDSQPNVSDIGKANSTSGYEIRALATTKGGAVHWVYPVHDLHVTRVGDDAERLPFHYEVWQEEGYSYEAHREVFYDQQNGTVLYLKNDKDRTEYKVDGFVNNEFSSFFNSRLMDFSPEQKFIVPTFADKRRVEVVVNVVGRKTIPDTILGAVDTVEVMPIMTFKGLYDKQGDTVIWYTDDECRVPVRINSRIVIGSLTAELKAYRNDACARYKPVLSKE